jgi:hypothetical protein
MKYKSITYQRTIPLGSFENHRIGVEIELGEGDKPEEVMEQAKEFVNGIHEKVITQKDEYRGTHIRTIENEKVEQVQRPTDRTEAIIFDINSCKEIKTLESYKLLASKIPSVKEAYEWKMNELLKQA